MTPRVRPGRDDDHDHDDDNRDDASRVGRAIEQEP